MRTAKNQRMRKVKRQPNLIKNLITMNQIKVKLIERFKILLLKCFRDLNGKLGKLRKGNYGKYTWECQSIRRRNFLKKKKSEIKTFSKKYYNERKFTFKSIRYKEFGRSTISIESVRN